MCIGSPYVNVLEFFFCVLDSLIMLNVTECSKHFLRVTDVKSRKKRNSDLIGRDYGVDRELK